MTRSEELLQHPEILASFARVAEYLRQVIAEQEALTLSGASQVKDAEPRKTVCETATTKESEPVATALTEEKQQV